MPFIIVAIILLLLIGIGGNIARGRTQEKHKIHAAAAHGRLKRESPESREAKISEAEYIKEYLDGLDRKNWNKAKRIWMWVGIGFLIIAVLNILVALLR